MEEVKKEEVVAVVDEPAVEVDPLKELQEKVTKLEEERDNYKNVALKRLGKLPGDAEFLDKDGSGELSVAEQVRLTLLDREIEASKKAEREATARLVKENSELRLALKNKPGGSIGGESNGSVEVKDNVFSPEQLRALEQKALRLKADPQAFIEKARLNFVNNRR